MFLQQIFDDTLAQYAYLVGCQRTGEALLIDPERDIDRFQAIAAANDLRITAVAETHIHADFVSGSREFLDSGGGGIKAYLSDMGDRDWKYTWAEGRDDVVLLQDGDVFEVGKIEIRAVHTPGHTPEHLSFLITDRGAGADEPIALATGDFVFVGDVGRPDLLETAAGQAGAQEPSARRLYQSVQLMRDLPEFLQILPGHGAGSACGKSLGAIPSTTVGYEKRFNPAVVTALEKGEEPFVDFILEGQPEPPLYFARMKSVNKLGPDVLGGLPEPGRWTVEELGEKFAEVVVLDLRRDRKAFMKSHLRGSLLAPAGDKFSVAAGSYLEASDRVVLLVEDESQTDPAVRQLVRMGFDHIVGFLCWEDVAEATDLLLSTETRTTAEVLELHTPGSKLIDVRGASEYAAGHMEGALNRAYTRLPATVLADEIAPDARVLVHCASGLRAAIASSWFERRGNEVVYLDGSIEDLLDAAAGSRGQSNA